MSAQDPRFAENIKAYRAAARASAVMLVVLLVVGGVVGWHQAGQSGLWSAVLGCSAAAVFTLSTQVAAIQGARKGAMGFVAAVSVTSVAKFLVIVIVGVVALQLDWLVRPLFGLMMLGGAVAGVVIDIVAVQRARIPYVVPERRDASGPDDEVR
ncbi:MAG: hypothetical protein DIU73_007940 [Actinomycetes bacterium]